MQPYRFSVTPRHIAQVLGSIIICLLCANVVGLILRFGFDFVTAKGLIPLFDVDIEQNIPTFFSVLMALFSVLLFTIIALDARRRGSSEARYWFTLAAGFLFLAFDEAFSVHERMSTPVQTIIGKEDLGYLHYSWVIPAMLAVLLATLYFFKFLMRLPATTRRRLLTAGALFLGGCIGMELIDGNHFAKYGYSLGYNLLVMIEEGLEMAGLATLVHALLSHIAESGARLEFNLHTEQAVPAPVLPGAVPELGGAPG